MKDKIIVGVTALAALDIMFNGGKIVCGVIKFAIKENKRIKHEEWLKSLDNNYFGC